MDGLVVPPDHERYFGEIRGTSSSGRTADSGAVQRLRGRHDIQRLTPPRFDPPGTSPRPADGEA